MQEQDRLVTSVRMVATRSSAIYQQAPPVGQIDLTNRLDSH